MRSSSSRTEPKSTWSSAELLTGKRLEQAAGLFLHRNSKRLHLPVQLTSFQAQHLGGAADVAVVVIKFLEDIVALVGGAGLVQRGEFACDGTAAAVAGGQGRPGVAVEAGGGGVHDPDAFDYVAQLAHVARPGIAHQGFDGIVGNLARAAAIGSGKLPQKMARQKGDVFLPFTSGRNGEGNH